MVIWIAVSSMAVPIGLFLLLFEPEGLPFLARLLLMILLLFSALFTDYYLAEIKVKEDKRE
mgnify:CR=1 FL=1